MIGSGGRFRRLTFSVCIATALCASENPEFRKNSLPFHPDGRVGEHDSLTGTKRIDCLTWSVPAGVAIIPRSATMRRAGAVENTTVLRGMFCGLALALPPASGEALHHITRCDVSRPERSAGHRPCRRPPLAESGRIKAALCLASVM